MTGDRLLPAAARFGLTPVVWRTAFDMLRNLDAALGSARVISLDHDLEPVESGTDPGDGLLVAKRLAELAPVCPIVVHTSNNVRGDAMERELDLAGWTYRRILPIGDDWVEVDWYHTVLRLVRRRSDRPG